MPKIAAKALLGALFAVCVFRAITQSIVYDEALTYQLYIGAPFSAIFSYFDANNHFLSTILVHLSAAVFGVSEWSLRLPALAGGVLYFTAVYRLAKAAFGEGWTFLLAVAALSLNPFVLDFMVVARGYGPALALWMWALMLLYSCLSATEIPRRQLAIAGACLALSVTANLTFAPAAAALAGIAIYLLAKRPPAVESGKDRRGKRATAEKRSLAPWLWFTIPIGGIALMFLLLAPVEKMEASNFYTGAATIRESMRSLATSSVQHTGPLRAQPWMATWRDVLAFGIGPLVVAGGLFAGVARRNLLLLLTAGPAAFSAIAVVILHAARDMPYPEDRTGLYFLPLVTLTLVGLAYSEQARAVSFAAYALTAILIVNFATEFNVHKFLVWEYDADTRSMAQYISRNRPQGGGPVRVGGSWQLWESLEFYKTLYRWDWLEIERVRPAPGYEYYAFIPQDRTAARTLGLAEVYVGPLSGSVLTVQPPPAERSTP